MRMSVEKIGELLDRLLQEKTVEKQAETLERLLSHPATQPKSPLSVEIQTDPEEIVDKLLLFLGNGNPRVGENVLRELLKRASKYGIKRVRISKTKPNIRETLYEKAKTNPKEFLRFLADLLVPERYIIHEIHKSINALRNIAEASDFLDHYTRLVIQQRADKIRSLKKRLEFLAEDQYSPMHREHTLLTNIAELEEHMNEIDKAETIGPIRDKIHEVHISLNTLHREILRESAKTRLMEIKDLARKLQAKKRYDLR